MRNKTRDGMLNIIMNKDAAKDNHGVTAKMKEKIQRRIDGCPETKEFKKGNRMDDMQMLSKMLQRHAKDFRNISGR